MSISSGFLFYLLYVDWTDIGVSSLKLNEGRGPLCPVEEAAVSLADITKNLSQSNRCRACGSGFETLHERVSIHLTGQQQQQQQQWRRAAEVSGNFIHQLTDLN